MRWLGVEAVVLDLSVVWSLGKRRIASRSGTTSGARKPVVPSILHLELQVVQTTPLDLLQEAKLFLDIGQWLGEMELLLFVGYGELRSLRLPLQVGGGHHHRSLPLPLGPLPLRRTNVKTQQ